MFKIVKATRRARRSTSPPTGRQAQTIPTPSITSLISPPVLSAETQMHNFFDAESACAFQRPWLRIERGLRLQKFRQFSEEYPGLTPEESENLYRTLVRANDNRLLNTKQQITYEDCKIQAIRGLKMTRIGDGPATFRIEAPAVRLTKKATAAASVKNDAIASS